jgi:hypothetical protein
MSARPAMVRALQTANAASSRSLDEDTGDGGASDRITHHVVLFPDART